MTQEELLNLKPGTRILARPHGHGQHTVPGTAVKSATMVGRLDFLSDDACSRYTMRTPDEYKLMDPAPTPTGFAYYVVKNSNGGYSSLFKKLVTAQEQAQDGSEILGVTLSPVSKCSKTFTKEG